MKKKNNSSSDAFVLGISMGTCFGIMLVVLSNEIIYFPLENGDYSAIVENQRLQKIKFRRLSIQYKESICYMAQQILELNSDSSVRKAIKFIEKGA